MTPSKGYYSLVQYCPDRSRLEAANVGVLLVCPERRFAKALTVPSNDRIRRFFGDELDIDLDHLNMAKKGIEDRVSAEQHRLVRLEELVALAGSLGNDIQITPPRPMVVQNPEEDLRQLLEDLVAGRRRRSHRSREERLAREALQEAFERHSLLPVIRKDVTVHVSAFDEDVTVPFAYRNGRLNLVRPVGFERTNWQAKACRYAVEARSLYTHEHPEHGELQLVLFAEFAPDIGIASSTVRHILNETPEVRVYTRDGIDDLLADVRHARVA